MRYFGFVVSLLIIVGAGCATTTETSTHTQYTADVPTPQIEGEAIQGETLEESWQRIVDTVDANDCETFKGMFVYTVELTQTDCDNFFAMFKKGPPPIDWTKTEYKDYPTSDRGDIKGAEVMMTNGRTLTTFFLESDGVWRASTKFWQ